MNAITSLDRPASEMLGDDEALIRRDMQALIARATALSTRRTGADARNLIDLAECLASNLTFVEKQESPEAMFQADMATWARERQFERLLSPMGV